MPVSSSGDDIMVDFTETSKRGQAGFE
jgi:hypothetical protein